jgi:hypothetical protein
MITTPQIIIVVSANSAVKKLRVRVPNELISHALRVSTVIPKKQLNQKIKTKIHWTHFNNSISLTRLDFDIW